MAKHSVLRLAACLSTASALAWSQTNIDPPKAKTTASLEGKVVSLTTGNPLKKTNLLLRPAQGGKTLTAESDEQGLFSFPTVEPGRYTMTGERTGYAKQAYGARGPSSPGSTLTLVASQEMKELVFKLAPNAVISGKVLDEDGDPMANAAVMALRAGYQGGKKQYVDAGEGMVGANGEYSISLTAGRYLLAAVSMGSLVAGLQGSSSKPPGDQPEPAYGTVFYPRSHDETGAAPVDAAAGAELRGMDFYMTKVNTFRVRGKLSEAPNGKQALAILQPRASMVNATLAPKMTRVQPDGTFEFVGVTPGEWVLRAAGESTISGALQTVTVQDKHISGLLLSMVPFDDVTGVVRLKGKESPKGILVSLDGMESSAKGGQGPVGEDGKFAVKMVLPDHYRVSISNAPAGVYLQSVRFGDRDVTDTGFDLSAGSPGSLEVLLNSDGAEISGVVAGDDGIPMSGVTVALIPNTRQSRLFKGDTTDQSGAFKFQGLAPGDYNLLAWEDVAWGAWYDPEFLKPVEGKAESVTVKENDRKSVTLKAIPVETKR